MDLHANHGFLSNDSIKGVYTSFGISLSAKACFSFLINSDNRLDWASFLSVLFWFSEISPALCGGVVPEMSKSNFSR